MKRKQRNARVQSRQPLNTELRAIRRSPTYKGTMGSSGRRRVRVEKNVVRGIMLQHGTRQNKSNRKRSSKSGSFGSRCLNAAVEPAGSSQSGKCCRCERKEKSTTDFSVIWCCVQSAAYTGIVNFRCCDSTGNPSVPRIEWTTSYTPEQNGLRLRRIKLPSSYGNHKCYTFTTTKGYWFLHKFSLCSRDAFVAIFDRVP